MSELWPLEHAYEDPHSDIHWDLVGYGYEDYIAHGGQLNQSEYERLGAEFDQSLRSGRLDVPLETINTLRLAPPFVIPPIPPIEPYHPMSETDIIRIATDYLPSLGQDAPDLVFGPWQDELDSSLEYDRRLLRRALCIAGVEAIQGSRFSGAEMWARSNITPTVEARARVRMVSDAPQGLWKITRRNGDDVELNDLIGLDEAYLPPSTVTMVEPLSLGSTEENYLLARVAYSPSGWQAHLPLLIPSVPPATVIQRWIQQELWHARLRRRKITLERMLRRRGHVLIRRVHEWLWLREHRPSNVQLER